jgi:hypothetical protein
MGFGRRSQHAPRFETIVIALIVTIVGVLGTFGKIIPTIAGFDSVTIGMWCYIVATVILLIGVFFRRL